MANAKKTLPFKKGDVVLIDGRESTVVVNGKEYQVVPQIPAKISEVTKEGDFVVVEYEFRNGNSGSFKIKL